MVVWTYDARMSEGAILSRRGFLRSAALAAAAGAGVALAACGGPAAAPASQPGPAGGSAAASAKPASSASGAASASGQASRGVLKVASTTTAGTQTPLWLAEELHFWTNRGLTVERSIIDSTIGTKALINKDVDVLMQSPPPMIAINANGSVQLVYVGSIYNHSQFGLAVPAEIKTAADLKGKPVGTDLPGSVNYFQTEVMFQKLGLKDSDVTLVPLQSSQGIYAALLQGEIKGAPLGVPQPFQAEGQGFHLLADTFDIKYQNIGPMVLKSRIPELRTRLAALLLGIRDGMQAFTAQPELAKKLISGNTKETDQAILQKTYDFYSKSTQFNLSLQPTLEGIQSMIDFLSQSTIPAAKNAKAEQFVDTSILDQLPAS